MDKKEFKEYSINLLNEGKTISEISRLTNKSRKYITTLLKDDERYINLKNNKRIKVYKRKNGSHMMIYIPTSYIEALGVTKDRNKSDYVNVCFDKKNSVIMIEKA